jgi:4-carboxymuconolactone decarboxylase|nr:carboxymuconolactone decarboxylase family protein [Acidaminococcus massiliensis]
MEKKQWFHHLMAGVLTVVTASGIGLQTGEVLAMEQKKEPVKVVQTAGRDQLGTFAPDFARYNDDILFGEVWSANDRLSLHDRSLVTVTALIAQGLTDSSLQYHMATAKKNGVTREEMVQAITQLGFYSGWPKAWAAFRYAKEVYGNE